MNSALQAAAEAIVSKLDAGADRKATAQAIAAYLVESRQTHNLAALCQKIESIRQRQGVVEVSVQTARPLSGAQQTAIVDLAKQIVPKARSVVVAAKVDPGLIGGVRMQVAGKDFDASLRQKLTRLLHT